MGRPLPSRQTEGQQAQEADEADFFLWQSIDFGVKYFG
jgi:hypothetical protein